MSGFDRELKDLPKTKRRREWMNRIEAVLFASSAPVDAKSLARVIGQGAKVEALIEDLSSELEERSFMIAKVAGGWVIKTRKRYADAIQEAASLGAGQGVKLSEFDTAVLAAIAYHQPITRSDLGGIFGREVSRDLIGRLRMQDLIAPGPRSPRPGAPYTFVTTDAFLFAFDLCSLRDLPDREQLLDAGLVD